MPRHANGVRLYLRKRAKREPVWVIRDRGNEIATGCSEGDREQAEKALADYIARKYQSPSGPCHPDQMSCGRALQIYGNEHAPAGLQKSEPRKGEPRQWNSNQPAQNHA